jgi:hypothetical protein
MRTPGISGTLAFTEGVFTGPLFGALAVSNVNPTVGNIVGVPSDVAGSPINGAAIQILLLTGAQVGVFTYTLPSVASIVAAQSAPYAQQDIVFWQYMLRVVNVGTTQTVTIVAPAAGGWTFSGGLLTAPSNTTRDFLVQITSPTTANLLSIGTGNYS